MFWELSEDRNEELLDVIVGRCGELTHRFEDNGSFPERQ